MRTKSKFPKSNICVRVSLKTLEKLDKIANEREVERSELIRKILEQYVKNIELDIYA